MECYFTPLPHWTHMIYTLALFQSFDSHIVQPIGCFGSERETNCILRIYPPQFPRGGALVADRLVHHIVEALPICWM